MLSVLQMMTVCLVIILMVMVSLLVFLWLGLGEVPIYYARTLFPLVVVWSLLEGWVESRAGKGP